MKKRLNWILAAVLALAMVLGISFTGTFAAEETAPESYIAVNVCQYAGFLGKRIKPLPGSRI